PAPPSLANPTLLSVQVGLSVPRAGKAELYGGSGNDTSLLLGSTANPDSATVFLHLLPVTNLHVDRSTVVGPTRLTFDSTYPANLVGTYTTRETSGTSSPLPAALAGLRFDVIRGKVSNLSRAASGGVNLGPVTCLA